MSKIKRKVVLIISCPHSGSTLLELMLCGHKECVGIGEAFQLVDPRNKQIEVLDIERCSCGSVIPECVVWGGVVKSLKDNTYHDPADRYRLIFDKFSEVYGSGKLIVDSSKVLQSLELIHSIPEIDLRVIHLVRDVRGWTVSIQENYRRNPEYDMRRLIQSRGLKGIVRFIRRSRFYTAHSWYHMQKSFDRFLSTNQISNYLLSYEDLCMDPESAIRGICDYLGLEYEKNMVTLADPQSHNIFGNRMRLQAGKQQRISYDMRWFYIQDWVLPLLIFPHIMSYNRKLLYSRRKSRNETIKTRHRSSGRSAGL